MKIIADCILENCPRGGVFYEGREDWSREAQHLPGWRNALGGGPHWKLLDLYLDMGKEGPFLERISGHEVCLIAGDRLMSCYTVQGQFRMLTERNRPTNSDDMWSIVGRVGPIARMMDLRRYYQLCLEGLDRLALCRRDDEVWHELASVPMRLSPWVYYDLSLTATANRLTARMDGQVVLEAQDDHYPYGWPGIRCHAVARMRKIQVLVDEPGRVVNENLQKKRQAAVDVLRAAVPQAHLVKRLEMGPLSDLAGLMVFRLNDAPVFLFFGPDSLVLTDAFLKEIWNRKISLTNFVSCELDGPGAMRLVGIADEAVVVLNAATGQELRRARLPAADPYRQREGTAINPLFSGVTPARLHAGSPVLDLILRHESGGGSRRFHAYDNSLKPLWDIFIPRPPGAHGIHVTDINSPGVDEICAGLHILDHKGKLVWSAPDADIFPPHGGDHIDKVVMERMEDLDHPERLYLAVATGHEGLFVYERNSRKLLFRHPFGHVQSVQADRFISERKDKQFWAVTRWDSYGISCVIAPDGKVLSRFQPNFISDSIVPVDWIGNNVKLALAGGRVVDRENLGLIDWKGNLVVPIPPAEVGLDKHHSHGSAVVADVTGDKRPEILIRNSGNLWIYTQGSPSRG